MASNDDDRIASAIALARSFVDRAADAEASLGRSARGRARRLAALVQSEAAADFTVRLTDEVSRIDEPPRAARRFAALVADADLSALPMLDRVQLAVGARLAPRLPRLVMPLVQRRLRYEADGVVLPASDPGFADHVRARHADGMRLNVNVLGEAIVGDDEARRRLAQVTARLRRSDVDYVSVKISAVCASIDPLAFDDTVDRVVERLRPLYELAASFDPPKFVNLDMEEYHDLDLTVAACRRVLDEPALESLDAGIVIQAYLPDVQTVARELGAWAQRRRRRGGGRLKIRVVKGANLAMEAAAAELAGWPAAPLPTKAEVDANYKAVLDILCEPEFDDAVRIGVASHNLFDVAWAIGLRRSMLAGERPDRIEFEMLEGMAPAQAEAVRSVAGDLLLYAPVVSRHDFPAAIAYLVRRLDENTAEQNFLAHVFRLADDPARFDIEAQRFATAVRQRGSVDVSPRRRQDRRDEPERRPLEAPFENEPDTDWTRSANRHWVAEALRDPEPTADVDTAAIDTAEIDPAAIGTAAIDTVIARATAAFSSWSSQPASVRAELVDRVGHELARRRLEAIGVMAAEASKTVEQGDPEVSEAIDFAHYYARSALHLDRLDGVTGTGRGVVVVAPPWNFPLAIPAGGVLAALAAGNTVVLKPAPQTRRTARVVAEACWAAGVPHDVVQFVPADDDEAGRRLITHPDVDTVILTGAHDTAERFHEWRPDLRLVGETSGKNALVISATADRDDAVRDLVASAFGHAGQKCSAASLAIVEAPLYDDAAFLGRIRDAAATLRAGRATDLSTDVAPLVEAPNDRLWRALTTLDAGERWLLEPRCTSDDGRTWTPGIKVGVRPDSWFARTECFGPVLGIVRADDLDHAVEIQNASEFGLTAGLHALDPAEIRRWSERVEAGNVYVNRGITGAIVQRQPFGGWKRSSVGPTAKAGGPNYVATLMRWADDPSTGGDRSDEVRGRFERWWRDVGTATHDPTGLAVERNEFRYRPLPGGVAVRFGADVTDHERSLVAIAARVTGCRLVTSEADDETAEAFAARVGEVGIDRARMLGADVDPGHVIARACHDHGIAYDDAPPVSAPEIELPRWLREQSVSVTNHRHGRVIDTDRGPVAAAPPE